MPFNTETIILQKLSNLVPLLTEQICTGLQISYSATGGTFSFSVLKGSFVNLPGENLVLSLPFGRVGVVKQVGSGWSPGGMVDTVSGPALPLSATEQNFTGVNPGGVAFLSVLATALAGGVTVFWQGQNPTVANFVYRGNALSGIQSLAALMLLDIIVRKDGIYSVLPGQLVGGNIPFSVPKTDIVSASQSIDYSQDVKSILNPALTTVQAQLEGDFVYDDLHAQKQPKFTVQAGAPGAQGSKDFIPIPDGWLVDGNFEEWTPPSTTDFTNPDSTVNGRYWKVFQSPSDATKLRGITNFTRLVKQIQIPGNVSPFVGSPITALTRQGTLREFVFDGDSTESGIYGFTATETSMFDVISNQFLTFNNAIVLRPNGAVDSGDADTNFFSITMELWTFPRVNPQTFPVGNPINPFGLAKDVVVISPPSSIPNSFWSSYVSNFKLINSPRLKTTLSSVYRNYLPQVGDQLLVPNGLRYSDCGRIQGVSLSMGRSGVVVNVTADKYQFGPGLYQL